MNEYISIDKRFRGPPESGNGGYSCGRLAAFIEGPACVRLMIPPPLNSQLTVITDDKEARLLHGDKTVAKAWSARPALNPPLPPSIAAAKSASDTFRGFSEHFFPGCFVCGTERGHDGGLEVFGGPLVGREQQVAAFWVPGDDLCDEQGRVLPVFIWSALDCPGGYTFKPKDNHYILLGEMNTEIHRYPRGGDELRVLGWHIAVNGRRHTVGTALFDSQDECIALAKATWFDVAY